MITSCANGRETPYATSAHVTAEPSSHVTPGRSVNVHVLAALLGTPVLVAKSATRDEPAAPAVGLYETKLR